MQTSMFLNKDGSKQRPIFVASAATTTAPRQQSQGVEPAQRCRNQAVMILRARVIQVIDVSSQRSRSLK